MDIYPIGCAKRFNGSGIIALTIVAPPLPDQGFFGIGRDLKGVVYNCKQVVETIAVEVGVKRPKLVAEHALG